MQSPPFVVLWACGSSLHHHLQATRKQSKQVHKSDLSLIVPSYSLVPQFPSTFSRVLPLLSVLEVFFLQLTPFQDLAHIPSSYIVSYPWLFLLFCLPSEHKESHGTSHKTCNLHDRAFLSRLTGCCKIFDWSLEFLEYNISITFIPASSNLTVNTTAMKCFPISGKHLLHWVDGFVTCWTPGCSSPFRKCRHFCQYLGPWSEVKVSSFQLWLDSLP